MTPDTDTLKRLAEQTTPGPWKFDGETTVVMTDGDVEPWICEVNFDGVAEGQAEADASLIALAPALLREVLDLRAEVEELRGAADIQGERGRAVMTIYACPTPQEITSWAESALRKVPDGSLTRAFMRELIADFADGLSALRPPPPRRPAMANDAQMPDPLVISIARIIDHPSVYMGGPSRNALRIAGEIVKHHRSALCASGQQVRALEWREGGMNHILARADTPFWLEYLIWSDLMLHGCKDGPQGPYPSLEAAKAAAQADYTRRILAALTPAPQPEGQQVRDARSDIGILLAQIDWLQECLGETLESEDGAVVAQIRADWSPAALTPAPQPAGEAVPVAWQQRHQGSWINMSEEWTAQDCSDWPQNEFRPLYTHSPQPSEAVAEAALREARKNMQHIKERLVVGMRSRNGTLELVEAHQCKIDAALRSMKGGA